MTFEPAALAAGARPNQRKPWENLQGSPASVGTSCPTGSTTVHPIPNPSLAQPHEATLDHMPTKQVLGLDWHLYFINKSRAGWHGRACHYQTAAPSPVSRAPRAAPASPAHPSSQAGVSAAQGGSEGQAVPPLSRCGCPSPALRRLHGASSAAAGSSRHPSLGPGVCCTHRPRSRRPPALRQSPPPAARMRRAPGRSSSSIWSVGSGTRPGAPAQLAASTLQAPCGAGSRTHLHLRLGHAQGIGQPRSLRTCQVLGLLKRLLQSKDLVSREGWARVLLLVDAVSQVSRGYRRGREMWVSSGQPTARDSSPFVRTPQPSVTTESLHTCSSPYQNFIPASGLQPRPRRAELPSVEVPQRWDRHLLVKHSAKWWC